MSKVMSTFFLAFFLLSCVSHARPDCIKNDSEAKYQECMNGNGKSYQETESERLAAEALKAKELQEAQSKQEDDQNARRARLLRVKAQLSENYKQSIASAVKRKFIPPEDSEGMQCTVLAELIYPNEIADVSIVDCSEGSTVEFEHAIEKAVWSAVPFPLPPHKSVFERQIRFDFTLQ